MTTALPLSNLINITLNLSAVPLPVQNFQTALILGSSTVIDTVQRYRTYTNFTGVANDFSSSAPEYLAAQAWFNQSPTPNILYIGRWVAANSAAQLVCGPLSTTNSALATWTAITSGGFKITVNGGLLTITGLDFHLATSLSGVASVIQAGLNSALASTTCVYQAPYNNFVITSPTTGTGSTITVLSAPGSGTDISAIMSGTTATGAYPATGLAAETALAAVTYFDTTYPTLWYGLYVCGGVAADYLAIQAYIEAESGQHFQAIPTQDANTLVANDTTNLAYQLKAATYNYCLCFYSATSLYAAVSALSRISTTNWNAANSAITLMYKQLPGITADTLNSTQVANAAAYNCNMYVNYSLQGTSYPIVQYGICPSGQYVDSVVGACVLKSTILSNMFTALATGNKIPMTDAGQSILDNQIVLACESFVANGYLGPEVWDGPSFGNLATGQWVEKGYYIYQPPVSSLSATVRATRASVPFQVAAVLAGAVHTASVLINVAP
jgi:hypothetical protein